jgi:hypothetical protein
MSPGGQQHDAVQGDVAEDQAVEAVPAGASRRGQPAVRTDAPQDEER